MFKILIAEDDAELRLLFQKVLTKNGYDVIGVGDGQAALNEKKQELFIGRDHFGIKPLYYTINDDSFVFASQIKSILKFPRY